MKAVCVNVEVVQFLLNEREIGYMYDLTVWMWKCCGVIKPLSQSLLLAYEYKPTHLLLVISFIVPIGWKKWNARDLPS